MKQKLAFAMVCLLALVSAAQAQNRPLRVQVGGPRFILGGVSLDVKKNVSVYLDKRLSSGFGCVAFVPPGEPLPATRLDRFSGIGVSMRQPLRSNAWIGLGLGGYTRHYEDCFSLKRHVTGVGGKVFAGYGRGVLLGELTFHAPGNLKNATPGLTVGVRL